MNKISVIGLDLAKNVFQVHGVDSAGEVVVRKQLKRSQVRRFFTNVEPCLVGMEACGGAHYWTRELAGLGHTVRMMAPVFVKPYLKSNKNDRNDAEAICEAVQRTEHALCATQDTRTAVCFAPASCASLAGSPTGCSEQSPAGDSLGVRYRSAARNQSPIRASAGAVGGCRKRPADAAP